LGCGLKNFLIFFAAEEKVPIFRQKVPVPKNEEWQEIRTF
jgi:hypothetical protein